MNMTTEPIRLPAIVVAVLVVVGPVAIAALMGADVKTAIATAIGGLIASGGVIGVTESRRARTDSPATIDARIKGLAATPLPEDERTGCEG